MTSEATRHVFIYTRGGQVLSVLIKGHAQQAELRRDL